LNKEADFFNIHHLYNHSPIKLTYFVGMLYSVTRLPELCYLLSGKLSQTGIPETPSHTSYNLGTVEKQNYSLVSNNNTYTM